MLQRVKLFPFNHRALFLEWASGSFGKYCATVLSPGGHNKPSVRALRRQSRGLSFAGVRRLLKDMLSLSPLGQESLFHRSIMDLGFCDVILVKEENTR